MLTFLIQKPLPAASRPSDVSLWIQNARRGLIVLKKPNDYLDPWWTWWDSINPVADVHTDGFIRAEDVDDWSSLAKAGPNGFVNVLMSLVGLFDVATDVEWRTALAEVTWVLRGVRAAVEAAAEAVS